MLRGNSLRAAVRAIGLAACLGFCSARGLAGEIDVEHPVPGVGPAGPTTKLSGTYKFTEGPSADATGRLYFTDVPAAKIFRLEPDGQVTEWLDSSGRANGLMFNGAGELVACQMTGQVVAFSLATRAPRVLARSTAAHKLNSPNDLVVDRTGGVYFSDPQFPTGKQPDNSAVYWVSADGQTLNRLIEGLKMPNGVILSPDESTLYVVPTFQAEIMAYPVLAPGQLGEGRVWARMEQPPGRENTGGDGCTVDTEGRLYVTTNLGVQVFDGRGQMLGHLVFPEQPSNCTFGGPERHTLYVTARTSVYQVPMLATGHVFPGGGGAK